jgi:CheY-like chemotaxis protein
VDVMMPNVDGWQIISELRNGPATSQVPIVICSILPLESLALSLGFAASSSSQRFG